MSVSKTCNPVLRTDSADAPVQRFDLTRLGKAKKTPQGFLKYDAALTRIGVLQYRRADGSIQRELRLPEEVFRDDSLETLAGAPLTDLHVAEVTPANVRQVQVGRVGDQIKHDDRFVKSVVTVQDKNTIDKVGRGDRKELSAGYRCRIDATPGVYNGEPYDVIQRDIEYNHVAIGPEGWGRAGGEVALRLDGDAAASLDNEVSPVIPSSTNLDPPGPRRDQQPRAGESTMKRHIRIDGIEYEVEGNEAAFQAFDRWVTKRDGDEKEASEKLATVETKADSDAKAATAKFEELQGKYDAQEKDLTENKKKLDEANDPKRLDDLANARADLVGKAREVLGKDEKLDGLTERQIKEKVLEKIDTEVKLDGRSDEYVDGLFDQSVKNHKPKRADGAAGARAAGTPPPPADGGTGQPRSALQARKDMMNDSEGAWRPKASA